VIGGQSGELQSGPLQLNDLQSTSDSSSPFMQSLKLSQIALLSMQIPVPPHRNVFLGQIDRRRWQTLSSSPPGQSGLLLHTNEADMQLLLLAQ
jgi:hypothetical protein